MWMPTGRSALPFSHAKPIDNARHARVRRAGRRGRKCANSQSKGPPGTRLAPTKDHAAHQVCSPPRWAARSHTAADYTRMGVLALLVVRRGCSDLGGGR